MFRCLSSLGNSSDEANMFPNKFRNIFFSPCDFSSGNNCLLCLSTFEKKAVGDIVSWFAHARSERRIGNNASRFAELRKYG
jgi:hypothetical protein